VKDSKANQEKRAIQRYPLQLPVTVTAKLGHCAGAMGESRDVSSHGICFYCNEPIERGSAIDFTLVLPPEITMSVPLRVRCTGTVVRTENRSHGDQRFSVAASIQSYEFVAEDELPEAVPEADAPPTL
jgi:PilZ domain